MIKYLLARLKEPSTWRGLILVATACGIGLAPAQMEAITFVGLLVTGGLGATTPDTNPGDKK